MTDRRIVDEYKKIKPTPELKNRILCEVLAKESEKTAKPFWKRMMPVMSGALACLLLVMCLNVIPLGGSIDPNSQLGYGVFSVAYVDGTEIMPSSNTYALAKLIEDGYEFSQRTDGKIGAEFTFEFEGKTRIDTKYGFVYEKTEDGKYNLLPADSVLEGTVTLFWEMPDGESDEECVMTLVNRSGEWRLGLELFPYGYKANLVSAE